MIGPEETIFQQIDSLIGANKSFALYRLPRQHEIHFIFKETGQPLLLHSYNELEHRAGFVFSPFDLTDDCPLVVIEPNVIASGLDLISEVLKDICIRLRLPLPDPVIHARLERKNTLETFQAYRDSFFAFSKALQEKRFHKLVLSRMLSHSTETSISPAKIFFKACNKYASSYVYLCYTPHTGIWLGATPEILLARNKENTWQTMALAGTRELNILVDEKEWDDKNKQEQEFVSAYIRKQLRLLGISWREEGPYTYQTSHVAHLRTDFYFHTESHCKLHDMIRMLHPTPAVCGLPKEAARHFILTHEKYSRQYYTGFVGWADAAGATDLFVNLRCMQICPDSIRLYAGGGLLAESDLQSEWQETEAKLQTMLSLLNE